MNVFAQFTMGRKQCIVQIRSINESKLLDTDRHHLPVD